MGEVEAKKDMGISSKIGGFLSFSKQCKIKK